MLTFPLLSDAYGAVLAAADWGKSRGRLDEARGLNPEAYPAGPIPPDDDDEDLEVTLPDDDDDLEKAPTRPLRLDRLRL
ncbi:MAG: hypothetical protein ACM369_14100 [Acidobacteriota bacterium]|jgi:hypothetical protein